MDYYVCIPQLGKSIKECTHKLVQGFTVSEEYNETLDSANIIIGDSYQLDLNPYDDVFIFSEYCGYYDIDEDKLVPNYEEKFEFVGYPLNSFGVNNNYISSKMPFFYKHFLIDQFNEEMIILGKDATDTKYKYTIDLFSETKGLETVQAPNISVTQPLNDDKTSTYQYVLQYLTLFNKKIKLLNSGSDLLDWKYKKKNLIFGKNNDGKYVLTNVNDKKISALKTIDISNTNTLDFILIEGLNGSIDNATEVKKDTYKSKNIPIIKNGKFFTINNSSKPIIINGTYKRIRVLNQKYNYPTMLEPLYSIFKNSYCPDFMLNSPSLRQILEKLCITKDCIPVVRDDEIFVMDITKRRGEFDLQRGQINYITGSKSSDNFCTDLKRTYNGALTQENSTRYVDYLGFRNSDSALLTLDNLRIETRFPIYKINKLYMCYFKKIKYFNNDSGEVNDKIFLCKQDITKLVKLNSERNILSEDIADYENKIITSIDELSKFKLATVGYDIGSNYIQGWGTKYSYPVNFFWQNEVKSYIENLFNFMNVNYKYGIYSYDYLINKMTGDGVKPDSFDFFSYNTIRESIIIPDYKVDYDEDYLNMLDNLIEASINGIIDDEVNFTLKLKHLFFQIDYQGFYNGTIIHSKGLGKDNLTINDNQSASLTLLELDGLSQQEKLNRYGNKGIQISARYDDYGDIQGLGSVYNHNKDNDVIIFHKQYSINSSVVNCTYYGSKDYVLKNYFTTVFAKHRAYNLMSYGESVSRAENKKVYFIISKNKKIKDKEFEIKFENFGYASHFIKKCFSFMNDSIMNYIGRIETPEKINYGYFQTVDNDKFASDINVFVCGNSLCLNIIMYDNVTSGVRIDKMRNKYFNYSDNNFVIGSTQSWLNMVDSSLNGKIKNLKFVFGHVQSSGNDFIDENQIYDLATFDKNNIYKKINNLPLLSSQPIVKNSLSFDCDIYKDNKERIDMTLQIEPIGDEGVFISPWLLKLSDLFSAYEKYNENKTITASKQEKIINKIYTVSAGVGGVGVRVPVVILAVNKTDDNWINNYPPQLEEALAELEGSVVLSERPTTPVNQKNKITFFGLSIKEITEVSSKEFIIKANTSFNVAVDSGGNEFNSFKEENETFIFSSNTLEMADINAKITNIYEYIKEAFLNYSGLDDEQVVVFMCALRKDTDSIIAQTYGGREWMCWAGSGNNYMYKDSWSPQGDLSYRFGEIQKMIKQKNLFWVYVHSSYNFKQHMTYDELTDLSPFQQLDINFSWESNTQLKISYKDLGNDYTGENYNGQILCYYKTPSGYYNVVFGVDKPNKNGSTDLHFSVTSFKDLTLYDSKTNLPVGEVPIK